MGQLSVLQERRRRRQQHDRRIVHLEEASVGAGAMNVLLTLITPVFVYVANQASGKVTVIDAARDSVVAVIDFTTLGFSAHPKPHHIVVEPDGSYWYVSLVGDNVAVKLDRANQIAVYDAKREQVGIVDVPGGDTSQVIVQLAVSPDGRTLVATAQLTDRLLVFDLADPAKPKLVQKVPTGDWPWLVSFTPDGGEVWLPNQRSNDVTVIDAKHWSVLTTVKGDFAQPDGIGISGDGRFVFVANHNTSNIMNMGGISMAMPAEPAPGTTAAPGRVIVIDARRREVLRRIDTVPDGSGLGVAGGKP